jgi:hypothetical protein
MGDMAEEVTGQTQEWMKTDAGVMKRVTELRESSKQSTLIAGALVGTAAAALLFLDGAVLAAQGSYAASRDVNLLSVARTVIPAVCLGLGVGQGIGAIGERNEANVLQAALISGMMKQN